jgi:hypothetical protein
MKEPSLADIHSLGNDSIVSMVDVGGEKSGVAGFKIGAIPAGQSQSPWTYGVAWTLDNLPNQPEPTCTTYLPVLPTSTLQTSSTSPHL